MGGIGTSLEFGAAGMRASCAAVETSCRGVWPKTSAQRALVPSRLAATNQRMRRAEFMLFRSGLRDLWSRGRVTLCEIQLAQRLDLQQTGQVGDGHPLHAERGDIRCKAGS